MDIEKTIKELALNEKAALVSGTDFMFTNPVPRLGIGSTRMSDGPHGLRVQKEGGDNGVTGSEPATCFPAGATLSSSWNPENAYKMGEAIAEEALHYGIDVLLGPGVCIKRNPLCGRNFEYFSEDPLLSGKMGSSEIKGLQSKNVGACVKHFALNDAENYRFMGDSVADMRAIREIYLKAFEIVVKESHPHAAMCAYNKINGEYCSENEWLLTDVLRKEWGFDGLVMSDWGATHDRVKGLSAGLDLEMPGDSAICRRRILDSIKEGTLAMSDLDKAVSNVLRLTDRYESNPKGLSVDWKAHDDLAVQIALDSAVLLKNEGMLPLREGEPILAIGDLFERMRYQGSGSSMINPTFLSTPKTAFEDHDVPFEFCRGYRENELEPDENLIAEALKKCPGYDKVLVFAGLTDAVESEGGDREDMRLPANQLALIDALAKAGKRIAVILFGGSPVEVPFADQAEAILDMYLPGQGGGEATYDLLFGKRSPCGKLAETWPKSYEDVPFGDAFSKTAIEIYRESVFVGYRYYLTAGKEVRYPFGFGLSYTSFSYSDMSIEESDAGYEVSCKITNEGRFDGAEIVELYVRGPKGVYKPAKELKGFAKVYLKAGETKRVDIAVSKGDLRYWNVKESRFVLEGGEYEFQLCSDSRTIRLKEVRTLDGDLTAMPYPEDINAIYQRLDWKEVTDEAFQRTSGLTLPSLPPKKPITLESRFSDLRSASFMGRILFDAVLGVAKKDMRRAKRLPEGPERDNKIKGALFLKRVLESNSLVTMSMSASEGFPYNFAEGFAHFANGHLLKGIKCFCTKIKVPKLPKEEK